MFMFRCLNSRPSTLFDFRFVIRIGGEHFRNFSCKLYEELKILAFLRNIESSKTIFILEREITKHGGRTRKCCLFERGRGPALQRRHTTYFSFFFTRSSLECPHLRFLKIKNVRKRMVTFIFSSCWRTNKKNIIFYFDSRFFKNSLNLVLENILKLFWFETIPENSFLLEENTRP